MAAVGPKPPEMGGHVCANGRGLFHVRFREGSAESRPPSAFTDGASDPKRTFGLLPPKHTELGSVPKLFWQMMGSPMATSVLMIDHAA